ncbi:mis18-binding protein 1 isoform X2 [Salarias fasciatus]|uniref:mis18-binding protein 1 isoform X2 n=1 Tax=Salarias fasciatus TaxID=181472 RepID=UPI001176A9C8|nr:mis18-binding protein 1 isoform X2 [Salarias fasciatus]
MASHYYALQRPAPWLESPAKAFAKLKYKVQTETMRRTEERPAAAGRPRRAGSVSTTASSGELSEARALTLSPIPSPPRTCGASGSGSQTEEESPGESGGGRGRAPRAFLESTAVLTKPPQIRDFGGCDVSEIRGHHVFTEDSVVSPMKTRLRKRVLRPRLRRTSGDKNHASCYSHRRKLPAARPEDRSEPPPPAASTDTRRGSVLDQSPPSSPVQMFPYACERESQRNLQRDGSSRTFVLNGGKADQFLVRRLEDVNMRTAPERVTGGSDSSHSECELTEDVPLRALRDDGPLPNRYHARVAQNTPMSPAKVFALMKDRENRRDPQKGPQLCRRELSHADEVQQLRDAPHSKPEDSASRNTSESVCAHVPSDAEPSGNTAQSPAAAPLSTLLEDPLLLNSPQVFIPKREATALNSRWPSHIKLPSESVIYLKKWCLRKTKKGLYVDGIHCSENVHWNSNVIVERISKTVLKTVSGRIYILVGRMMKSVSSDFPQWLLKKFVNGFPSDWKRLFEKFQSESRNCRSGGRRKSDDGRRNTAKKKPEASSVRAKKPLSPAGPSPPLDSAKVSRSGRLVIPPLDYWRGGRVVLDAHMNVTIHECYETTIPVPTALAIQPACPSEAPVRLPPAGDKGASAQRPTRGPRAKKPPASSSSPGPASKGSKTSKEESPPLQKPQVSRKVRSPEEPEAKVPQRRGRAEKSSRQKSNNPSTTVSRTRRNNLKSPEAAVEISESSSSDEDCSHKRRGRRRRAPSSRGGAVPGRAPPELLSSEESVQEPGKKRSAAQTKAKPSRSKRPTASPETRSAEQRHGRHAPESSRPPQKAKRRKAEAPKAADMCEQKNSDQSSDDDFTHKRRNQRRRGTAPSRAPPDPQSSEESVREPGKKRSAAPTKAKPSRTKRPTASPSSRRPKVRTGKAATQQDPDEDRWTEAELKRLQEAVSCYPRHTPGYWERVAGMVETRSAEQCHGRYTALESSQPPPQKATRRKAEAPKAADVPLISARAGTLKRKQQVRQFLEAMPRDDMDDAFSSAHMQNKRVEIQTLCLNEDSDIVLSELEPLTPRSACFPEAKTPQCLHITPGMMGSPNRSNDDKYVFQLQKRMKKSRFDVQKRSRPSKKFTPTPSVKKPLRRCDQTGNDSFVVWEMFSGKELASPDSGEEEEEDFYFSDSD